MLIRPSVYVSLYSARYVSGIRRTSVRDTNVLYMLILLWVLMSVQSTQSIHYAPDRCKYNRVC